MRIYQTVRILYAARYFSFALTLRAGESMTNFTESPRTFPYSVILFKEYEYLNEGHYAIVPIIWHKEPLISIRENLINTSSPILGGFFEFFSDAKNVIVLYNLAVTNF